MQIWERLTEELPPEVLRRHAVTCGDARQFQGRERDIMYLSMVCAPNDIGAPLSRDVFAQRFNVAASRARDRMVLVRSVELEQLSESDRLRRGLIAHFARPFAEEPVRVNDVMVAPIDLVAAAAPDPVELGKSFVGKTVAGTWVKGKRGGLGRELYLYQVADNQECVETFGTQAVVGQTAFTAVITLELLATGKLAGYRDNPEIGVRSPEEFCADPYVALMADLGFPGGVMEMDSEYKRAQERGALESAAS